jgi:EAL domain-containing protein (putative c-di-GMP-specific phosphodiesterase class I)
MACQGCRDGEELGFAFTMAFQPIVDLRQNTVWGYEALVRGADGASAADVLARVTEDNRYKFDQACRVKAIELAGRLFPDDGSRLSINFMPNAVYEPNACIRASLGAAKRAGFDPRRLMFEFTEDERIGDPSHLQNIIATYKNMGFVTAIDDFGAGYAGLGLLAVMQPDIIKIDMQLVRGIATSAPKQAIVASLATLGRQLNITVLAEGIETQAELEIIRASGISLGQGYLFARPAIESLPPISLPLAA